MATRVKTIKFVRNFTAEDKIPQQMKDTVAAVIEAGKLGEAMTTADIAKLMTGKVSTRQPEERILAFYTKRFESEGIIEVERGETAAPKEKKPKKDKANAAPAATDDVDADADEDEDEDDDELEDEDDEDELDDEDEDENN